MQASLCCSCLQFGLEINRCFSIPGCNKVLTQAFCRGVILDQLSINKATVSLSVGSATVFAPTCLLEWSNTSCFVGFVFLLTEHDVP